MRAISTGDCKKKLPVWFFSFLFFAILYIGFGVGIYPDSETYLNMVAEREPLYPLFLHLCRSKELAVILQNVLAACSVAYFTITMQEFFLNRASRAWKTVGTIVLWGCAVLPHLMTPLGSASHMVLSNAVLTEGLTYPLYLFFSTELIRGLLSQGTRQRWMAMGRSLFCVFLLLLLRNQMLTTLSIWIIVVCFVIFTNGNAWRERFLGWGAAFLVVALVLAAKNICFTIYYQTYCNGYSGAELGNVGFLANTLYLAREGEDAIIAETELEPLYGQMLAARDEKRLAYVKQSGVIARALHYEDCYDPLKFEVIQPILEQELYASGVTGPEVNAQVYHRCGELFHALLPEVMTDYIRLFFDNLCLGLIRSVSLPRGIFIAYGILVYVALIGLLLWKQVKRRSLAVRLLLALSLGMTLLHVAATSAVIMCLSRYVIYNTTLLYCAGFVGLAEEFAMRNRK